MTSEKQILANRQNALASTGPKTSEGKLAVRLNAVRHGLRAQDALLPNEDPHELAAFADSLHAELKPQGHLEERLVERITTALWRLQRVERVEAGIFTHNYYQVLGEQANREAKGDAVFTWGEMRVHRTNRRGSGPQVDDDVRSKALAQRKEAETVLKSDTAVLGRAFMKGTNNTDAFAKLSTYEANLERSLYKAMHELQRLQEARGGEPTVTITVVEDTVSE